VITFSPTTDINEIRAIVMPMYDKLHDDFGPPAAEWMPPIHELVEYLIIRDADELLGMAVVGKCSAVMCEAHNLLLPHLGWKRRLRVAKEFFIWAEKQGYRRVVGKVPSWNRYAMAFDHAIGMKLFGINEKAIMRNGHLEDEVCFGISLPRTS
jgi:hypothetical protein